MTNLTNVPNVTTSLANLENVTCSSHRVIARITGHRSQAKLGQNQMSPLSPLSPLHLRHCRAAWIDHQYLQGLIGLKIGAQHVYDVVQHGPILSVGAPADGSTEPQEMACLGKC